MICSGSNMLVRTAGSTAWCVVCQQQVPTRGAYPMKRIEPHEQLEETG